MMRPALVPDAFLSTYVDDRGWGWVVVRRAWAPRVAIRDPVTHRLVELADGSRTVDELATAASAQVGASLSSRDVLEMLEPLVAAGAIVEASSLLGEGPPPPPSGLVVARLTEEELAQVRLHVLDGTGFDCDGRGACCHLYDRIAVRPADIANLERAYPERYLPGGLTLDSALRADRAEPDLFTLAVVDGGCVVLEEDGRCGVHRRLGLAHKPSGCRGYPLQHVLCEGELAVGIAAECRCAIDFAEGPSILPWAEATWAELGRARVFEAVAPWIQLTERRRVSRAEYLTWRREAGQRLVDRDPLEWAMEEAAALGGGDGHPVLSRLRPLVDEIARLLEFEARDRARIYPELDRQRALFAWAAATAARLQAALARADRSGPPQAGERLVATQTLHAHALLRSRSVSTALVGLTLRFALARSAADTLPAMLLPVSTFEFLGRASFLGELVERATSIVERAIAP